MQLLIQSADPKDIFIFIFILLMKERRIIVVLTGILHICYYSDENRSLASRCIYPKAVYPRHASALAL